MTSLFAYMRIRLRAAEKLRQQGSVDGAIASFPVRDRSAPQRHGVNVTLPLVLSTCDTAVLLPAAKTAVRAWFRSGYRCAKAGAALNERQPGRHEQD